jgi:hypothetical protein
MLRVQWQVASMSQRLHKQIQEQNQNLHNQNNNHRKERGLSMITYKVYFWQQHTLNHENILCFENYCKHKNQSASHIKLALYFTSVKH